MRMILFLLIAVLIASAVAAVTPLFSDSFESYPVGVYPSGRGGNGFSWTQGNGHNGGVVVSNDTAYSGSKSLRFFFQGVPNGTDDSAEARFQMTPTAGTGYKEIWIQYEVLYPLNYYHRVQPPALGDDSYKLFAIWQESYSPPNLVMVGGVDPDGSGGSWDNSELFGYDPATGSQGYAKTLRPSGNHAANPLVSSTGPIVPGKWATIGIHLKTSSSNTSTDGLYELYVNGKLVSWIHNTTRGGIFWNNGGLPTSYWRNGYLFGWNNAGYDQNTSIYVDDFKLYTTNPGWGNGSTNIPPAPTGETPGDLNNDGTVNLQDLIIEVQNIHKTSGWTAGADLNGDGKVNIFDLVLLVHHWTVSSPPPDTTPPVVSGGSPSGTLGAGTTSATLSVTTNEAATCKYSTVPGTVYASMPSTFSTTGGTSHSTTVTGLANGTSYAYYVRCQDTSGNADTTDTTISFSVASSGSSTTALLDGYTVNAANQPSGPIPTGWTLVDAQGFESGSLNPNESKNGDNTLGISSSMGYTGTHSLDSYITSSYRGYGLKIPGTDINSRDVYISYWRYVTDSDPGYGYDDTDWYVAVRSPPSYSTPGYGLIIDQAPPGSCCMSLSGHAVVYGSIPNGPPASWGGNGGLTWAYTPGKWQQIQVHIKANDPGQTNGVVQEYVDGVQVLDCSAATGCPYNQWCTSTNCPIPGDFVGNTDYSTGDLYIGGDWGKDVWYNDSAHTICSTTGDVGMGPVNVNMSNPQCPNQAPPNGVVPYFHIYIDDVIVLKK